MISNGAPGRVVADDSLLIRKAHAGLVAIVDHPLLIHCSDGCRAVEECYDDGLWLGTSAICFAHFVDSCRNRLSKMAKRIDACTPRVSACHCDVYTFDAQKSRMS